MTTNVLTYEVTDQLVRNKFKMPHIFLYHYNQHHSLEAEPLHGEGHLGGPEDSLMLEYDPLSIKDLDLTHTKKKKLLILLLKVLFSSPFYRIDLDKVKKEIA